MESTRTGTGPVDEFLHAIENATIGDCQAWSADASLDATVPNWRLHASGADAIRVEYAKWFADCGHFDELNRYQIDSADSPDSADRADSPGGGNTELIEYTLSWQENGVPHAAHHMHLLTIKDGFIVSDKVFCGGRWPASLLADMEAANG